VLAGGRDPQRGTKAAREVGATFLRIDPTNDDSVEAAGYATNTGTSTC
jgi:hypothetical protein